MLQHTESPKSRPLSFLTDPIRERARQLSREGRHDAAMAEYQVLCDTDPDDIEASHKLAHHLLKSGHHDRAADEYLRLAACYVRRGHPRRAKTVAVRALRVAPERVLARRLAPMVEGLGSRAAALCEQVARVHLLRGQGELARDVLRLLVNHDPRALLRRMRIAELDLAEGRHEDALAELRIVADGLRSRGRTAELVRVLEMMHAHGGSDRAVLSELAGIYLRWGQPRRALTKLSALHHIAPDDRTTLERLARVHASLGQLELAVRLLGRLVDLLLAHAGRGELRAMLARCGSWCSDASYQQAIETLSLRALRRQSLDHERLLGTLGSRRATHPVPPPLPRWTRRGRRPRAVTGEIHIAEDIDTLDVVVLRGSEPAAVASAVA